MLVSAFFGSLLVLALASVASGVPHALKLRQIITPPRNWVDLGRAPRAHIIPLRIALPQLRFPELEQHLAEISDPSHARYGEHLSKADVEELVAPHASSVDAVYGWLESHGVQKEACHQSPAGDWVTVRVPVVQAEEMLGTVSHHASFAPKANSMPVLGVPPVATRAGRRYPRAHNRVQPTRTPRQAHRAHPADDGVQSRQGPAHDVPLLSYSQHGPSLPHFRRGDLRAGVGSEGQRELQVDDHGFMSQAALQRGRLRPKGGT